MHVAVAVPFLTLTSTTTWQPLAARPTLSAMPAFPALLAVAECAVFVVLK